MAEQLKQMAEQYPQNWTLYDFQTVVDNLHYMIAWIDDGGGDPFCFSVDAFYNVNQTYQPWTCPNFNLTDPGNLPLNDHALTPTLCWASARPSLGESSLFSCTDVSTCCDDSGKCDRCSRCPTPKIQGQMQYGCDSLLQQCRCAVTPLSHDVCASSSQCGDAQHCSLVSAFDRTVYGSTYCSQCGSGTVACMLQSGSSAGQCSCIMEKVLPLSTCMDAPGTITMVRGSDHACGYAPGLSATRSNWQFDFGDLMLVPCGQVSTAVCSIVYNVDNGGAASMAVALQLSGQPTSSRRLLMDAVETRRVQLPEDRDSGGSDWRGLRDSFAATGWDYHELMTPEDFAWVVEGLNWSSVAAPCSTLIQVLLLDAGENASSLSWVELERLHDCVYWRHIGHHVVQAFNLTSVAPHDAFLLSVDDLMFTLRHTDLLRQCVLNPGIVGAALLAHPWARPVRFVAHEAWEWVSRLSATRFPGSARQNSTDDLLTEELKAMMEELELKAMMEELEAREVPELELKAMMEELETREVPEEEAHHSRRLLSTPVRLRHVRPSRRLNNTVQRHLLRTVQPPRRHLLQTVQPPRRHLLQTLDQTVLSVQQYSASVLHAASMARQQQARVTGAAAEALTRGPFSWPPTYFQQDVAAGLGSCFVAEVLLKHVQTVLQVRPPLLYEALLISRVCVWREGIPLKTRV